MFQVDSSEAGQAGDKNDLVDLGELLHYLARGQLNAAVLAANLGKCPITAFPSLSSTG